MGIKGLNSQRLGDEQSPNLVFVCVNCKQYSETAPKKCASCSHGLFKVVKNSKFKEMVAFSKYESIEEPACEAKDFSGMQVINKFAGKTTKF